MVCEGGIMVSLREELENRAEERKIRMMISDSLDYIDINSLNITEINKNRIKISFEVEK